MTVVAALVTGLVTSIHCVAMCGPLACSIARNGQTRNSLAYIGYHGGRLMSYGAIGAFCGALGEQPLRWIFQTPAVILPWALVVVFLTTALGIWKRLPRIHFRDHGFARLRMKSIRLTAEREAVTMGFTTPLLTLGLLIFFGYYPLFH